MAKKLLEIKNKDGQGKPLKELMQEEVDSEQKEKSKKLEPLDAVAEGKKLTDARNFKTANDQYDIARENELMVTGIHWNGEKSKNLKKTTYNMIGQTQEIKNAAILANELSSRRKPYAVDKKHKETMAAVKGFAEADKLVWERVDMNNMNDMIVYDGSIQQLGVSYWWWDDDITIGNSFSTKGDINGKTMNAIDLYCANPAQVDIQKQPWVKGTVDMTVGELKDYAKKKGVTQDLIDQIVADEEGKVYRAFDKSDDSDGEADPEDQVAQLVYNFRKIDGQIYKSESSRTVPIEEWKDIEMKLYPIAIFPYKIRKSFIYAEAEMTRYIENQKVGNKQAAMRHLHAALMAIPKVLVNEKMIGSFSNAIGSVNMVKAPPGTPLRNAMDYAQPTAMTLDVDKSIDDSFNRTQKFAGVNEAIQGASKAENAAALLTLIKQANLPIVPFQKRLYKYVKDCLLIWEEFYKTKYNVTRKFTDDDGNEIDFTGTDYKDISVVTGVDVGPSQQWSDITSYQAMLDLWDRGIVKDANKVIERMPFDMVKDHEGLMTDSNNEQLLQTFLQLFIQTQAPEIQQELTELPPEELNERVMELIQPK